MDFLNDLEAIVRTKLTRKEFFHRSFQALLAFLSLSYVGGAFSKYRAFAAIGEKRGMREALFYEKIGDDTVKCMLCPVQCVMSNGQRSFCRVREPVDGKLYTLVYELICALHIDPIEKKPLFHMLPGSTALSLATAGCNSRCKYCQNWTISQRPPEETANDRVTVNNIIATARQNGCASIAYTYSEPVIFYEYALDCSKAARSANIRNILVTGGKINPEPLNMISKYVDAANVDLKGFDKKYMQEVCAQDLDNILQSLVLYKKNGVWVEVTNLIVPTLNDNMDDIKRMTVWIRDNLGKDTPLHFSRFWPQYKLRSLYPTPSETLIKARQVAMDTGLEYVYIGNLPVEGGEDTVCPSCKKKVIRRAGFSVIENNLKNGVCGNCGHAIPGIWK